MLSGGILCLEENRPEAKQEAHPHPTCSAETTEDLLTAAAGLEAVLISLSLYK